MTRSRRRAIAARALILLSAIYALVAVVVPAGTTKPPAAPAAPAPVAVTTTATLPVVVTAPALQPAPHPAVPTGLVIPALGVRAPVVPLAAEGSALTPPADYREAGWWRAGAKPGASTGHVLITGHTVHTGGGVFDDLGDLRSGDRIAVLTRRGRVAYDVMTARYLSVDELAARSSRLFGQQGPARLVLVTCSGWDGVEYHGNTVVVARPTSAFGTRVTGPK